MKVPHDTSRGGVSSEEKNCFGSDRLYRRPIKAAEIASALTQAGHDVHVVLTRHAAEFISPLTFETLTKNKAYADMFADEDHTRVTHIELGTNSDLILISPASFNIIGKMANGIADDLLSSILAAAPADKVLIAPAMNVKHVSKSRVPGQCDDFAFPGLPFDRAGGRPF